MFQLTPETLKELVDDQRSLGRLKDNDLFYVMADVIGTLSGALNDAYMALDGLPSQSKYSGDYVDFDCVEEARKSIPSIESKAGVWLRQDGGDTP